MSTANILSLPNDALECIFRGCDPATQRMLSWASTDCYKRCPRIPISGRDILCHAAFEGYTDVYAMLRAGSARSLYTDNTPIKNDLCIDGVNPANCIAVKSSLACVLDWWNRGWLDQYVLTVAAANARLDVFVSIFGSTRCGIHQLTYLSNVAAMHRGTDILRYIAYVLERSRPAYAVTTILVNEVTLHAAITNNDLLLLQWIRSRTPYMLDMTRTYGCTQEIFQEIYDNNRALFSTTWLKYMCVNRPDMLPWICSWVLRGTAMIFAIAQNLVPLADWLMKNGWVTTRLEDYEARRQNRTEILMIWREHDAIRGLCAL